jgi:hypothetical protein
VDTVAGEASAGKHSAAFGELQKERTRLLAAQSHPRLQLGAYQGIDRQPLAFTLPLAQDA